MLSCIFFCVHPKAHEDCGWKKSVNDRVFKKLKEINLQDLYVCNEDRHCCVWFGTSYTKINVLTHVVQTPTLQSLRDSYQSK